MDILIIAVFCMLLIGSIVTGIPLVAALLAGLILFGLYGLKCGFSPGEIGQMCLDGVKTVKNILITFFLIGIMTAFWRACGCIPTIVCFASGLITPSVFVLLTFLLNALVSVLTGTAFGTAATMGVICVSIAQSMNLPLFWVGGAMLSGVFFGDRCSPVSTSALLVSTLTDTDLYQNIKLMIKTAAVPFVISCIIYLAAGFSMKAGEGSMDVRAMFQSAFSIHWICLFPAVSILVAAVFRLNVKISMTISILLSLPIAMILQKKPVISLICWGVTGYKVNIGSLAGLINGGGITSMLRVAAIVCIASCYAGIFEKTGMLLFLERMIKKGGTRWGHFPVVMLVSVITGAMACNQTLSIMLTHQLTDVFRDTNEEKAIALEDTAVVISPLIPWSIAGSVPLATTGSPQICILGACFLYLIPLWRCGKSVIQREV